jgi:hypothetical protein
MIPPSSNSIYYTSVELASHRIYYDRPCEHEYYTLVWESIIFKIKNLK